MKRYAPQVEEVAQQPHRCCLRAPQLSAHAQRHPQQMVKRGVVVLRHQPADVGWGLLSALL